MKLLKLIVFVFLWLICFTARAQSDARYSFAEKCERFKKSETARLRWTRSPDSPESAAWAIPMPNAVDATKTHVLDPESGLWHYPNSGKVYDPETGYYTNYDAHRYYLYRTDIASGKIYKRKEEVEIRKIKQEEGKH
jgi:hypothetical protein